MGHRGGKPDVGHALSPHLGLDDLDPALVADHPPVLHALVFSAQALIVLDRSEDLGAEEPVALRLEGPVIDGLGLFDLSVGPLEYLLRRGYPDPDGLKAQGIFGLSEKREDSVHIPLP